MDPGRMVPGVGPMYLLSRCENRIAADGSERPSNRAKQPRPGQLYMSNFKDAGMHSNSLIVKVEKDRLKVSIAVCHYAPEDIKLEMVDGYVVIEAKHAERMEKRCSIAREFRRRFALPKLTNFEAVHAKMSLYGWLTIIVPLVKTDLAELWSPTGDCPVKVVYKRKDDPKWKDDPKQKDDHKPKDDLKQKDDTKQKEDPKQKYDPKQKEDQKDAGESKIDSDKKTKEPKRNRPIQIRLME